MLIKPFANNYHFDDRFPILIAFNKSIDHHHLLLTFYQYEFVGQEMTKRVSYGEKLEGMRLYLNAVASFRSPLLPTLNVKSS